MINVSTIKEDALIKFHNVLNPKLWEKNRLKLEVRVKLLKIGLEFYKFLDIPSLKIKDVVVTGSNASFNYTDYSDIDVHIIVDYSTVGCPNIIENLFMTKKSLWNEQHNINIRGYDIELYVEDCNEPPVANGVYSILDNEWRIQPSSKKPEYDDKTVILKTIYLMSSIRKIIKNYPSTTTINLIFDKLKKMRSAGLQNGGEFSTENLAFKNLRNLGFLDKLRIAKKEAIDNDLSLSETKWI